jgi:transposase-like protein
VTGNRLEQAERRRAVAERYVRGQTQCQIARALEIAQGTVSKDLTALRKEWLAASIGDVGARKAEELARLDAAEREFWAAWEQSKAERQSTRTRRRTKPTVNKDGQAVAGGEDEAEFRKEQRDGNPKFLEGILRCIQQRCEILGVNAPTKIAPVTPDGEEEYGRSFTDQERYALVTAVFARLGLGCPASLLGAEAGGTGGSAVDRADTPDAAGGADTGPVAGGSAGRPPPERAPAVRPPGWQDDGDLGLGPADGPA